MSTTSRDLANDGLRGGLGEEREPGSTADHAGSLRKAFKRFISVAFVQFEFQSSCGGAPAAAGRGIAAAELAFAAAEEGCCLRSSAMVYGSTKRGGGVCCSYKRPKVQRNRAASSRSWTLNPSTY